jgi:hypothetical protein
MGTAWAIRIRKRTICRKTEGQERITIMGVSGRKPIGHDCKHERPKGIWNSWWGASRRGWLAASLLN